MDIFCYGNFLDRKIEQHKPSSNDHELTQEQKWAHKCGDKWNKVFPFRKSRSSDELINEPESTPIKITDYFESIEDVVEDISSYHNHFLILTSRGDVYSMGDQTNGKCGILEEEYEQLVEEELETHGEGDHVNIEYKYSHGLRLNPMKIMNGIDTVATGKHHSIIITKRGDAYSFGRGVDGQLGNGTTKTILVPKRIPFFGKDGVYGTAVHASCGDFHTMVLTKNKIVYSFGRGREGQLGILPFLDLESQSEKERDFGQYFLHHPAPRSVKAYDYRNGPGRIYIPLVDVICGSRFTSILTNEREVLSFGEGMTGALSQGHTKNLNCPTQVVWEGTIIDDDENEQKEEEEQQQQQQVIRLESGWEHFVCVTDQGVAYSSGLNLRGQCGVGHSKNIKKLTRILGLERCTIEKIGCGGLYSACLTEDRNLYVCGNLPGRWNDYLEMTRIRWFEENGYKIVNIFCGGKNLFVQAVKVVVEEEESEDEEELRRRNHFVERDDDDEEEEEGEYVGDDQYVDERMGEGEDIYDEDDMNLL